MLRANQSTNGHKHEGQEEVYFFVKGKGEMEIDDNRFEVNEGDVICIQDGEFSEYLQYRRLWIVFCLCI